MSSFDSGNSSHLVPDSPTNRGQNRGQKIGIGDSQNGE